MTREKAHALMLRTRAEVSGLMESKRVTESALERARTADHNVARQLWDAKRRLMILEDRFESKGAES